MTRSSLLLVPALLTATLAPALAQQLNLFTLRVQQGQNIFQIANGQTLTLTSSAIGQASTLTLTGTYTGPTTAVISAQPQILGSPDFTITPIAGVPLTLLPGDAFKLNIAYTPSTSNPSVAQLLINFSQTPATPAGQPISGTITINLNGLVPNFSVDYLLPPSNNVTPILNGGTITFPATLIKNSTTATVVVANSGTGPSSVNSVVVTGAAFQLQGLGLLPAGIPSGGTISFVVRYTPVNPGTDTGTLTLGLPNQTFTINLVGSATSSIISYFALNGQNTTPIGVGQQIAIPDTPIGVASSIAMQVQNTGTAPATVNSVSLSGNGFTVTNLPVLPITLLSGDSFTFNINFTPTQAGPAIGTLTIGPDRFQLTGNGLGAQLSYSYSSASSGVSVAVTPPQGTVLFPSVPLAQTTSTVFTVTNNGTSSATLTSIGVVGASAAAYTLSNLPALPAVLAPGDSLSFTINFKPLVQGLNSANLLINGQSFVLSAFGTSVPSLPQYQITGLTSPVQPFTQPSFGLAIAQAYPLDITGTLTMGVNSTVFATDPSVQFSTGGRSVSFTIPAGSTQAVFSNGSTQLQLQTGTVAETITLSPAFTTANGVSITSPNPAPLIVSIPQNAPTLLSASLQNFTTTGFSVFVEGFSSTRELGKLNLTFTGAPGVGITGTTFSIDVSQAASFWFRSGSSQPFGGLFAITIPVSVRVTNGSTTATLNGQVNVSATITNSIGTSNAATQ